MNPPNFNVLPLYPKDITIFLSSFPQLRASRKLLVLPNSGSTTKFLNEISITYFKMAIHPTKKL